MVEPTETMPSTILFHPSTAPSRSDPHAELAPSVMRPQTADSASSSSAPPADVASDRPVQTPSQREESISPSSVKSPTISSHQPEITSVTSPSRLPARSFRSLHAPDQ